MPGRTLLLVALFASSAVAARGSAPEPPEEALRVELGPDALAGNPWLEPTGGQDLSLRIRVPEGSVLQVDAAFLLTNPTGRAIRADLRWDGAPHGARPSAILRGEVVDALVLLPGETVDVGLVVEARGALGSSATLTFAVVEQGV